MTTRRRMRAVIGAATSTALLGVGIVAAGVAPAQAAAGCEARFETQSQWPGGFTANVHVTNLGDQLNGWSVGWTFTSNASVLNAWNAQAATAGGEAIFNLVITGSVLTILPLVVAFLLLQRYWQSGLASGSVKE